MKTFSIRLNVLSGVLLCSLISVQGAMAAPSLSLSVNPAAPGRTTTATVAILDATDVESYSLELDLSTGTTLTLPASAWFARGAYFPVAPFGSAPTVELNNYVESTARTRVFIDGFKPTGTTGTVGTVSFTVNPAAAIGAFQDITLSGAYYAKGSQSVIAFAPATSRFTAIAATTKNLSVAFAGSGSGTVTSNPSGIACITGSSSGCSSPFDSGSSVTLIPVGSNSSFSGWSGACTASAGNCVVIMDADKSATATFTAGSAMVKIDSVATPYYSIDAALDAVIAQGKTVRARNQIFTENVIMTSPVEIKVIGGYTDAGFTSLLPGSFTIIDGSLKVRGGTLRVDRIKVR